jgi:ANTAR domain-containing protein/GAF domain-containing protein
LCAESSGGQMANLDPAALASALRAFESVDPASLEPALRQMVDVIVELFGVSGAGVMFVDDARALRYVVCTEEPARALESAQVELGQGPCVDSLVHDRHVFSGDLETDERWPRLAEMVSGAGIRAVLGVPVHVAGAAVGSLNVYYDRPHAWDQSEVAGLVAFNRIVERLVETAVFAHRQGEVVTQLQHALENRVAIERAVGILMEREKLDAVAAFDRLRRVARAERRKVADVAEAILASAAASASAGQH